MSPISNRAQAAAATRERVLTAAGKLFSARGYERVTIRDIAERATLTVGAVYGHFTDKERLFDACFPSDSRQRRVAEAMLNAFKADPDAWRLATAAVRDRWLAAADRGLDAPSIQQAA
ncbi:helix-turn-helix domain-containing protein [Caulobacter sp. CCNWLY153]|uniref:helix-turn-helix domain-containing protein n=1 Tax=unclassified Caulobacter TaxID=2648921 RepID=UPI002FF0E515